MRSHLLLAGLGLTLLASAAFAQESTSAEQAQALTALLTERHLDAVAARDTDEPDRFIAALFYTETQLLVVSARYVSPQRLQAMLDQHAYRDVYTELQTASIVDSKVFFQDLKADGLRSGLKDAVDILYERVVTQTMFDGDWKKQGLTEAAYKEKFAAADARYARLLSQLVKALKERP